MALGGERAGPAGTRGRTAATKLNTDGLNTDGLNTDGADRRLLRSSVVSAVNRHPVVLAEPEDCRVDP